MSTSEIIYASKVDQRRLRVRTVDPEPLAEHVSSLARENGQWAYDVADGGDVPNSYNYPAETTAVLAVSDPEGRVVVWMRRIRAHAVTDGGVADSCVPGTRPLYDKRYRKPERMERAERLMREAHAAVIAEGVQKVA